VSQRKKNMKVSGVCACINAASAIVLGNIPHLGIGGKLVFMLSFLLFIGNSIRFIYFATPQGDPGE
jgi:hypothetical protein